MPKAEQQKVAKKLAKQPKAFLVPPPLIPQPNGRGALYAGGVPGHKGGGGRPPKLFKQFIHEVLSSYEHQTQIEAVLLNGNHPAFGAVFGKVLVHELGVPKFSDSGGEQGPAVTIDV